MILFTSSFMELAFVWNEIFVEDYLLETWNEIFEIMFEINSFIHAKKTIRLFMQLLKWSFYVKLLKTKIWFPRNFDFIILKHGIKCYAIISILLP